VRRSLAVLTRLTGGGGRRGGRRGGGGGGDEVRTGLSLAGLEASLAGELGALRALVALDAAALTDLSRHLLAVLARHVLAV